MKFADPIGNSQYAPLFVRLAVGAFLYMQGRAKLNGLPGYVLPSFVQEVKSYNILSDQMATVYAILIPYFQILVGGLLIIGLWTTLAGGAAALIIASYLYLFGVFNGDGKLLSKDVVLFAAAFSLMYSGSGMLSLDKFRKSG